MAEVGPSNCASQTDSVVLNMMEDPEETRCA